MWNLYIDESGRFDGQDCSVVAGLLVDGGRMRVSFNAARRRLAEIWAPAPWPPHASTNNVPASRLVYCLDPPPRGGEPPRARAIRELAVSLLGRCRAPGFVAPGFVRRTLSIKSTPHSQRAFIEMQATDGWLSHQFASEYAALTNLCDLQQQEMSCLVANLFGHFGTSGVALTGAAADPGWVDQEHGNAQVVYDAYVEALTVLFERLGRLLKGPPGRLGAVVASRFVRVGGLGDRVYLQPLFLRQIVARAAERAGIPSSLQIVVSTAHYGNAAPPGLVVVDWLANRLRSALRAAPPDWQTLAGTLSAAGSLGVPSHLPVERAPLAAPHIGPLPSIAMAGPPEQWIRDEAHTTASGVRPPGPGWAVDQAGTWVASFARPVPGAWP